MQAEKNNDYFMVCLFNISKGCKIMSHKNLFAEYYYFAFDNFIDLTDVKSHYSIIV